MSIQIVKINGKQKVKQFKSHVHLVGERHLMANRMEIIVITLAIIVCSIAVVFSIGAFAYADEVTINVPHPFNYDDCQTFSDKLGIPFTQCLFQGYSINNPDLVWDEETETYISIEQMEEEAKALYEEFIAEKQSDMTQEERAVANILEQDEESISTAERQLVVMANKIESLCKNDILAMQTYQEFEVATETYIDQNGEERLKLFKNWDLVAINLKAHQLLMNGKMATEHCIAQEKLNISTLSLNIYGEQSYEGKEVCVYGCNIYHAEHTYTDEFQQSVYDMMETGGNVVAPPTLREVICTSDTIGNWFKKQNACPAPTSRTVIQPELITPPDNSLWGDETRELMENFDKYMEGDETQQYNFVVQKKIYEDMENLK